MIQYLVILLDDAAVSYCSYSNSGRKQTGLIPIDTLKAGILYAMKENLNVQFVYPPKKLPQEYLDVIDSIDHTDIVGAGFNARPQNETDGQVLVIDDIRQLQQLEIKQGKNYVLRTDKQSLFNDWKSILPVLKVASRLNIVITDIETFTNSDFDTYKTLLGDLSKEVEQLYVDGLSPQVNLLTDRMMLTQMNNCGAGDNTITLAPDGNFYVCPAFYYAPAPTGREPDAAAVCKTGYSIGSLKDGLNIANAQLYKLDHAPICRHCDAWQCRRCIWFNRLTTLEVNTPSHEQCVVAHLERNASRELLHNIRTHGTFLPEMPEISKIDYLDPFDEKDQWE